MTVETRTQPIVSAGCKRFSPSGSTRRRTADTSGASRSARVSSAKSVGLAWKWRPRMRAAIWSRTRTGSMPGRRSMAWMTWVGSQACSTAAQMSADLSANTRKIVPSATPAASAITRVLTSTPCSASRGSVAAISALRRSSGVSRAITRPTIMSDHSLWKLFRSGRTRAGSLSRDELGKGFPATAGLTRIKRIKRAATCRCGRGARVGRRSRRDRSRARATAPWARPPPRRAGGRARRGSKDRRRRAR